MIEFGTGLVLALLVQGLGIVVNCAGSSSTSPPSVHKFKFPNEIAGLQRIPELGVEINSWSVIYFRAQSEEIIWSVDKNYLTEKDIGWFHQFCGSDSINKFYHFPGEEGDTQDKTRNCTWVGDLLVVHTTSRTLPNSPVNLIKAYRIVTLPNYFVQTDPSDPEKKQKCRFPDHLTDDNRFGAGIEIQEEPETGKRTYQLIDVPESMAQFVVSSKGEEYVMMYHVEDFDPGQADEVNKKCVTDLTAIAPIQVIRKSCRIQCEPLDVTDSQRIEL